MSSPDATMRLYLRYFLGTIVVWVVMVLATAVLVLGTRKGPAELILVICGGAIASLIWGLAWYLAGTRDHHVAAEPEANETAAAPATEASSRHAPWLYLAGTLVIWLAVLVVTWFIMRDTPQLVEEVLLILGLGVIWALVVVPGMFALGSAQRTSASRPTA